MCRRIRMWLANDQFMTSPEAAALLRKTAMERPSADGKTAGFLSAFPKRRRRAKRVPPRPSGSYDTVTSTGRAVRCWPRTCRFGRHRGARSRAAGSRSAPFGHDVAVALQLAVRAADQQGGGLLRSCRLPLLMRCRSRSASGRAGYVTSGVPSASRGIGELDHLIGRDLRYLVIFSRRSRGARRCGGSRESRSGNCDRRSCPSMNVNTRLTSPCRARCSGCR